MARLFTAQGRTATRVRTVEFLGTTPLVEREARWARYQVFATRSRQEGVYRISYTNGTQRIVLADSQLKGGVNIIEAKEGNMGMMFNPDRERHIMRQARNYIDITSTTGGTAQYRVSTALGAARLTDVFGREFPNEMASGQLLIEWAPW